LRVTVLIGIRRPLPGTGGLAGAGCRERLAGLDPAKDTDAMPQILGSSISYRTAVGPQQGRHHHRKPKAHFESGAGDAAKNMDAGLVGLRKSVQFASKIYAHLLALMNI